MTDYQKYINALRKCAKEHENDTTYTGHIIVSNLCRDTANLLEALEQEPTTKNDLGVDCISRKAVLDITWQDPSYTDPLNVLTEVRDKVRELPSVTPQEPKKGHWIKGYTFPDGVYWKCDKCNELIKVKIPMHYCNNCGADMREVEE